MEVKALAPKKNKFVKNLEGVVNTPSAIYTLMRSQLEKLQQQDLQIFYDVFITSANWN